MGVYRILLAICFPISSYGYFDLGNMGSYYGFSKDRFFVKHVYGHGFAWIPEISHLCRILGFRSFEECGGIIEMRGGSLCCGIPFPLDFQGYLPLS